MDPDIERIGQLQQSLDLMTPKDKKAFLRELKKHQQISLPCVLLYIAITQKKSTAEAYQMLTEKAADGAISVSGVNVQTGVRENIPTAVFRDGNA